MIRDTHLQTLRELVEQARRDLAGYERILDRAQQEARVGMTFPDPLTAPAPLGQWSNPNPAQLPDVWNTPVPPPAGARPWTLDDQPLTPAPASNGDARRTAPYAANFDGTLPQEKEAVLDEFHAEHQADADTEKAAKEQRKWEQA